MSDLQQIHFVWEIVHAAFLPCDGRLMPINQYQALFLLRTRFGGNGSTHFRTAQIQSNGPTRVYGR